MAGIEQRIIPAENLRERKLELLVAVLRAVPDSRTLVFCSGKGTAKWVRAQLQRLMARVSSCPLRPSVPARHFKTYN